MKGLCCIFVFLVTWLTSPLQGGVEEVLQKLTYRCKESKSDSVLITQNGRVLFEYRSNPYWQPLEANNITKSIAALAIALLMDEGKISSVDVPIYEFYPEWNQGNKRLITLRHILTHTSGLQADPSHEDIYIAKDIVQLALTADLVTQPGTCYFYNDKAVNLLSGIVKKVSGKSLSEYLALKLFGPLGIENVSWLSDSCGNEYAMSHMIITAPDLVKIGEVLANGGYYRGQRFLNKEWIDLMISPGCFGEPFCGMLWSLNFYNVECWWDSQLLQQYQECGIEPQYIQCLQSLQGRVMNMDGRIITPRGYNFFCKEMITLLGGSDRAENFISQVRSCHLPIARWSVGAMKSFSARGQQGQQLAIYPSQKVVAVRLTRSTTADPFHDFEALVEDLVYNMDY